MLDELELVTVLVQLSLWRFGFDAIYKTKATDNEEQSAKLAQKRSERLFVATLGKQVSDLILLTKHTVIPTDQLAALL